MYTYTYIKLSENCTKGSQLFLHHRGNLAHFRNDNGIVCCLQKKDCVLHSLYITVVGAVSFVGVVSVSSANDKHADGTF